MNVKLKQLAQQLEGELFTDKTIRTLYATDASAYREMPLAVAIPKTESDLKKLIACFRSAIASSSRIIKMSMITSATVNLSQSNPIRYE